MEVLLVAFGWVVVVPSVMVCLTCVSGHHAGTIVLLQMRHAVLVVDLICVSLEVNGFGPVALGVQMIA